MNAILGTAGHIDHGKTELVRALTGIETDRLPEERRRGISIELGFAWLDLPGLGRAGVVDVPGHERFVRQMLAGAQGFDLVLMVVAADDGVMPQTEEHFEICHLLAVRSAIFVITKSDLASAERIADVESEIQILAAGTRFESAPVSTVSARTGDGIEALRSRIASALHDLARPVSSGPFRLPVDRVFVVKGHGTVVTGTAAGGSVGVGDEIAIWPAGTAARIREIQVHERSVERAEAGRRVALNLGGFEHEHVARGDVVVAAGTEASTTRFDAHVEIRPCARRPVKSHDRVRLHVGTCEAPARIVWLATNAAVQPKGSAYAQIVTSQPVAAFRGDRFVLRDQTASRTLGGGVVVVARARKHKSGAPGVEALLQALQSEDEATRLQAYLRSTEALGTPAAAVASELGIDGESLRRLCDAPAVVRFAAAAPAPLLAARERFDAYVASLLGAVRAHHQTCANEPGIDLEKLRLAGVERVDARVFRALIDELAASAKLVRRGNIVAAASHRVALEPGNEAHASKVLEAVRGAALMPPTLAQLGEALGLPSRTLGEIVGVLVERDALVRVSADLVFAKEHLDDVAGRLRAHLEREREITAAGFRDLIGASRKYSIPLLDYFDRSGLTLRSGDVRRLRGR